MVSCSLFEERQNLARPRLATGDYGNVHGRGQSSAKRDTSVYVTTVEFAPDYCWQQDMEGDGVPFSIAVYRDGDEIMRVDGGNGAYVSAAQDMHRFVDGHLYTDFSSPSETVFMKDGAELFRYPGREMVCGFLVRNGDIYIVGQNRSGKGFSFRKNGIPLFSNTAGQVLGAFSHPCRPGGALYEEGGHLVFAYKTVTATAKKESVSCFIVVDGVSSQIPLDNRITGVYDFRESGGVRYIAADVNQPGMSPALFCGDEVTSFAKQTSGWQFSSCRLLWCGDEMHLVSEYSYDNWRNFMSVLWNVEPGSRRELTAIESTSDFYVDGNSYAFVSSSGGTVQEERFRRSSECIRMTGKSRSARRDAM